MASAAWPIPAVFHWFFWPVLRWFYGFLPPPRAPTLERASLPPLPRVRGPASPPGWPWISLSAAGGRGRMGCEGPFSAPGKSSASLQNLAVTLWG